MRRDITVLDLPEVILASDKELLFGGERKSNSQGGDFKYRTRFWADRKIWVHLSLPVGIPRVIPRLDAVVLAFIAQLR